MAVPEKADSETAAGVPGSASIPAGMLEAKSVSKSMCRFLQHEKVVRHGPDNEISPVAWPRRSVIALYDEGVARGDGQLDMVAVIRAIEAQTAAGSTSRVEGPR